MESMSSRTERVVQIVVDLVAIVVVFGIFGLVYGLVEPKTSYFSCIDSNEINYPDLPDTIPFWAVGVYCVLGPLFIIILVELKNAKYCREDDDRSTGRKTKDFLICLFHAISLFALGMAVTLLLTEIGKRWVGRLRPCFLSICNPDFSTITCQTPNGIYNTISTGGSFCRTDAKTVKDARLSWPSGHSSFSFYCMLFLILYLEARLRLLKLRYFKTLIQMTAAITAFLTAISRISDYKHRYSDVVSGSVLGIIVALFTTLVLGRVLWLLDERPRRFEIKQDISL